MGQVDTLLHVPVDNGTIGPVTFGPYQAGNHRQIAGSGRIVAS